MKLNLTTEKTMKRRIWADIYCPFCGKVILFLQDYIEFSEEGKLRIYHEGCLNKIRKIYEKDNKCK